MYNHTREESRICLSEGELWPVIEPAVWGLDGKAEHLLWGGSDYSFVNRWGRVTELSTEPFP